MPACLTNRFPPRLPVGLTLVACLLLPTACQRESQPHRRSNVLIITLDTTRADRLSCYGYPTQTSKNLDRLAQQGTLFTRAVAQAAVTPVSHASVFTGLNPYTHGLRVLHGLRENRLPESHVTLAEVLASVGYQTAAFVSAFPVAERFGLDQGFEKFDAAFLHDPPQKLVSRHGIVNVGRNQRRADETTDLALAWLAQTEQPFFLWLHYFDPHDAQLVPPDEYMADHPIPAGRPEDRLRGLYDVEISFMDMHIARVLDQLEQSGRSENTLIVVVADHGEGLGDHQWWTHGILYQEQIHVPLILAGPSIPAGKRCDFIVRTIDIMPTVLELAGVRPSQQPTMEGKSLVPLLTGSTADPGYLAYADSINMLTYISAVGTTHHKNDMLFAITDGTWKYIHHALRPLESELYNLKDDPRELNNLREAQPEQAERLLAELRRRNCVPTAPPGSSHMSPEDLERLKALGYVTP